MTRRRARHPSGRATDREIGVVAAVLVAGSEKAAAHRLGLSHSTVKHHVANARSKVGVATTAQLVWILAPRLPQPEAKAQPDDLPIRSSRPPLTRRVHLPMRRARLRGVAGQLARTPAAARPPLPEPAVSVAFPAETVQRAVRVAVPSADVTSWTVAADAYPARTPSTEALDRVVAMTGGGTVGIFVKTLRSLRHWPPITGLPEHLRESMIARFPWRVEADVYASQLLEILPTGLRGPRVYLVEELGDERARVWMEDVPPSDANWDAARYTAAARLLGRMAGRTLRDGLPERTPTLFTGLRFIFTGRTASSDIPAIRDPESWRHPAMAMVLSADRALREDLQRLADAAPAMIDELEALPSALAHGDACPQNLLAEPGRAGDFVLIDWGFTALAPVGYDLGQLLVGRAERGKLDIAELGALHDIVLDAYRRGLSDEGQEPRRRRRPTRLRRRDAPALRVHRTPVYGAPSPVRRGIASAPHRARSICALAPRPRHRPRMAPVMLASPLQSVRPLRTPQRTPERVGMAQSTD